MQRLSRLALALSALATLTLLSACVSLTTPDYRNTGRFSVTYQDGDGTHTTTGRYLYEEHATHKQLDLLTPLNGILARIELDPRQACLTRSSGESLCRASSEALLNEMLGFAIPVEALGELLRLGTMPANVSAWQARVRTKHPDGRIKLITITPLVPNNVSTLSIVAD